MYELCNDHGQPLFEATRDGRLPNHQIHTLLAWGQGLAPGSGSSDEFGLGTGRASTKGQGLGASRSKDLLVEGTGKGVDKDKDKGVDVRESKLATVADPMARNLLWQVILYILLTRILLNDILSTHIMLNDITY